MTVQEWLGEDNQLGIDIWERKYRYENESFDEWLDRVSGGDQEVRKLIKEKKFLFGGRILANRGLDKFGENVTLSNCFIAGTEVLTKTGYKNIEDVKKGEYVLSDDGAYHMVNEVMQRDYTGDIYCLSSLNFKKDIYCTPNHRFLTNHGWIRADELLFCDKEVEVQTDCYAPYQDMIMIAEGDCKYAQLKSINIIENYNGIVYNLSVEETHNYTVEGVIAHNCYVIAPPEDNIESIFECASKLARTYSYGGGCGIDLSKLAPKGAKVRNAAKETSGAVSFMDLYSLITGLISQNGRRGALMISLSCDHPDLEDFIEIKSDLNRVTKANISIRITDEFMKAVENKEMFILRFTRVETGETITKEIDAYKMFHKICEMNWDYAEPGMLFWDRIENLNLLSEDDNFHYAGVNPCVTGNTLILTENGYVKINDVVDKKVNVWNGFQYSEVIPHVTGYYQKMKRITFSDGNTLDCTLYHKFILSDDTRVEAKNLKIGDKLKKHYFPVINQGKSIDKQTAYTQGFFMGDGSSEKQRKRLSIKLFDKKRNVKNYLAYEKEYYCPSFDGDFLILPYEPDLFNKEFVPSVDYDVKSRLTWLAGYIDSDGTVQSIDGSISISSINKEILMKVKYMLNTLGCNACISMMHKGGYRELPKNNMTGEHESVYCQDSYRLLISATAVRHLINLGLKLHRINVNPEPNRETARFITVTKIEDINDCEVVYCFNEPINHSGVFNGVITAQCAEEPLPAGGSCLLGSINLAEFVDDQKNFLYDDFNETVRVAVKAMNDVLDEGLKLHPLQEQQNSVRDWRQIGIGVFGLSDMLIKMGIRYGSKEAVDICNDIGFTMIDQAIRTSAILASNHGYQGCYPKYNKKILNSSFLLENTTKTTYKLVEIYGMRNSQFLTIAPTGTLSTMLGVSGGIEPIFANYYTRKTESLHGEDKYYKVYTPIVKEYMDEHGLEDDSQLPDYFVTAKDLDYKERIDMQAIWQKHIDASISSTVNVSNSFSVEDVEGLYLYAWKQGLKGVTIFRDGCKRGAILTSDTSNTDKSGTNKSQKSDDQTQTILQNTVLNTSNNTFERGEVIPTDDTIIGLKRKLETGCGSLHCQAFFDPTCGELREIYLSKGSTGGCQNFMVGLSRMISAAARGGISLEDIVDQLMSTGCCPSYAKRGSSKGSCCPMAIAYALKDMHKQFNESFSKNVTVVKIPANAVFKKKDIEVKKYPIVKNIALCPECGEKLAFEGGCNICRGCGWSKCD